jgi:hypothetical protein
MDHEFLSIVEKLAILEGRIAPKDNIVAETSTKQKKPALFNNLKKDESAIPMVGGVEFAEDKMEEDVLSKVKNSLADYLKNAEEQIKQDKDLLAKKKQDLDLKKKELKDLDLQHKKQEETDEAYDMDQLQRDAAAGVKKSLDNLNKPKPEKSFMAQVGDKIIGGVKGAAKGFMHGSDAVEEAIPDMLEEGPIAIGDRVVVTAPNEYENMQGEVFDLGQRGAFIIVDIEGDLHSMHSSDVKVLHRAEDWQHDDEELAEEPNQTPAGGEGVANETDPTYAQGGNSTYAESASAPVKTMNVPLDEMGGSVLVEIHGDERDGFCIKRAGREMATRFATLEEAEMALEMYNAHRARMAAAEQTADYIEEK